MSDKKKISIGWDVGGWLNNKNCVSAIMCDGKELSWIIKPVTYKIKDRIPSLDKFLKIFFKDIEKLKDPEGYDVIIAIDAPLGFPDSYIKLISNPSELKLDAIYLEKNDKDNCEIYNQYAYRYTERIIFEKFKKKPLSAPFDKLGTNATVAISHVLAWAEELKNIKIIEVYPGLLKGKLKGDLLGKIEKEIKKLEDCKIMNALEYYKKIEHQETEEKIKVKHEKSDEVDSCLCALLGISKLDKSDNRVLFNMVGKEEYLEDSNFKTNKTLDEIAIIKKLIDREGWIDYPEL